MHFLLIRHPSPDWNAEDFSSLPSEYVLINGVSETVKDRGSCELAELVSIVDSLNVDDGVRIAALVPDELALSLRIAIPGRRTSAIAKAIPFAAEPFLAGDLHMNHVAHGEIRRGSPIDCLVIEHETMRALLDGYAKTGLDIDVMTTRTAMIDVDESQVAILCDGPDCILKTAEDAIRVGRTQVSEHLRELQLEIEAEVASFLVMTDPEDDIQDLQAILPSERLTIVRREHGALAELARRMYRTPVVNLLQGEYQREEKSDFEWRKLVVPTSIAASWIALAIAVLLGQGIWASFQHRGILEESELIFRSVFDEASNSQNPALRMAQRLPGSSAVGGMDFLGLWGHFLASNEATNSGLQVVLLRYSEQPRELVITCISGTTFDVEQLQSSMRGKGVSMEIVSQRTDATGERTNLRLTPTL